MGSSGSLYIRPVSPPPSHPVSVTLHMRPLCHLPSCHCASALRQCCSVFGLTCKFFCPLSSGLHLLIIFISPAHDTARTGDQTRTSRFFPIAEIELAVTEAT